MALKMADAKDYSYRDAIKKIKLPEAQILYCIRRLGRQNMSIFSKLFPMPQNKSRDELCAHFQSLGIEVQMAPRGRTEVKIYRDPDGLWVS